MPPPSESNILRTPSVLGTIEAVHPSPLEREVVDLFDQLRNRLLRYLFSFGLPAPDCEEILQETFLALFQHLQQGKSRESLRGWLFRVAHNLALRKRMRSRRDFQHVTEMTTAEETVADPAPSPEDQVFHSQNQQRMLAVVEALSDLDRRCLYLRAEGLRYREIARVLDMSLGSVSLSLGRSMARVARAIQR